MYNDGDIPYVKKGRSEPFENKLEIQSRTETLYIRVRDDHSHI